MKRNQIRCIDALQGLKSLPDNAVDMVFTSPPYWQLRDYHVNGQVGLESTPQQYLGALWRIMDEIKRVLREDGTCWINIGDKFGTEGTRMALPDGQRCWKKCLLGLPERFMLGMLERGWILRSKIVWHKPNALPASVKDRFTCTWEYVYLFTKSKRYFFDLDAVRAPHKSASLERTKHSRGGQRPARCSWTGLNAHNMCHPKGRNPGDFMAETGVLSKTTTGVYLTHGHQQFEYHPVGRNPGDCWKLSTRGFKGAHFATFPETLVERAVKTSPVGRCEQCAMPLERITEVERMGERSNMAAESATEKKRCKKQRLGQPDTRYETRRTTVGWKGCSCHAPMKPALVLDPFCGSGTTCAVAKRLGRNYLGFDLNPEYVAMARKRVAGVDRPAT